MQNSEGLLLLRHAKSTWNEEGRWQGLADPPLSALGQQDAYELAKHLAPFEFKAVYSSDLLRAAQTAAVLADQLGIGEVFIQPELRERDAGEWTGLTNDEIDERFPDVADLRASGQYVRPTGADNAGFQQRALGAIADLAQNDLPAVAITHGGFIRSVERALGNEASARVPNLSGRWVHTGNEGPLLGDVFIVEEISGTRAKAPDPAEEPQPL
jgi:probable phosphoglycerate mutase